MLPAGRPQSETISLPVAVERYFEVALYLLVLTGFGTLASTGGLDTPTVVFVGAALLFRGYILATRRSVLIPETWTTIVTLAYVAFYLADYLLISRAFLNATVHLVLFVLVVRVFSTRRYRDYYFLAVIAFLMVLAASVLTVDSTFLLAFAGFMLMAVATFILMEMRRASAQATIRSNPSNDEQAHRRMGISLASAAPALALFILLGAALIFFLLPRVSSGYLSAYAPGGEMATGFSDRVQLGRIGEIQQAHSLVMHIRIDDDPRGAFDLKWRGVTLNVFDGRAWFNPHERRLVPRSPDGLVFSSPNPTGETHRGGSSGSVVHYRVLMEPVSSNVFFLAPTPSTLEGEYSTVAMDGGGAVFDLDPEHPITSYQATSDIAQPNAAGLRTASDVYPADILLNYLQLPRLDPRIQPMAEQVTASAHNNYDKALAIEAYLRTKFGYTLQLPRTIPRDPLANFLFERKQGHCEYFASSMAVMLRTLQIPARVVNGFRTGEFNDLTSQYLVLASNAHSWVEAYFPGYGWISFDPTPAAPPQIRTGWSRAMLYVDALASFWREWVVNYDAGHQYSLSREATRNSLEWLQRLRNRARRNYEALVMDARRTQQTVSAAPVRWSVAGAIVTLLLLLGANARRLWRTLQRRQLAAHPEKSPRAAATIWYGRMARTLARHGWHKLPAQTPEEFVTRISDEAVRQRVTQFTQLYERARFGDSPEDACRLAALYEEISEAIRR